MKILTKDGCRVTKEMWLAHYDPKTEKMSYWEVVKVPTKPDRNVIAVELDLSGEIGAEYLDEAGLPISYVNECTMSFHI